MPDRELSTLIEIICRVGGVPSLSPDQDLYDAGVSSVNALPLLIELEEQFQVTIPDEKFLEARTALAIQSLVVELKKGSPA